MYRMITTVCSKPVSAAFLNEYTSIDKGTTLLHLIIDIQTR